MVISRSYYLVIPIIIDGIGNIIVQNRGMDTKLRLFMIVQY